MTGDRANLSLVLECLDLIERYLTGAGGGLDYSRLHREQMTQDAVVWRLEMLSDTLGKLSTELKERNPTFPWRKVRGFRNVLAHAYAELDLEQVEFVLRSDLPAVRALVMRELSVG